MIDPPSRMFRFCEALTLAAGWLLLGAAVIVTIEVVGRKFFGFSLQGADELAGYALALTATAGFSHALVLRRHIRVDLLARRFPVKARALLHLAAYLTMTGFALLLFARAVSVLWESWELQSRSITPLGTPLVIPQGLWVLTSAVFLAVALFLTSRLCRMVRRNDWAAAERNFAITDDISSGASDDAEARPS